MKNLSEPLKKKFREKSTDNKRLPEEPDFNWIGIKYSRNAEGGLQDLLEE